MGGRGGMRPRRGGMVYGRQRPTSMRQPRRLQGNNVYGRQRRGRNGRTGRRGGRRTRPRHQRQCYTWRYSCQVVHTCPAAATSAATAITAHSTQFCKCPHGTYLKRHVDMDYDYEGRRNTRTTVYYCDHESMCPTHGYTTNHNCHCSAHETKEYRHIRRGTTSIFGAYCQRRAAFNPTSRNTHHATSSMQRHCMRYHFEQECNLARGCTWDPNTSGCSAGFAGDSAHGFQHGYIHRPRPQPRV